MCIRDRSAHQRGRGALPGAARGAGARPHVRSRRAARGTACLLYTSDAADERSSVDLGGRRIIKQKNCTKYLLVRIML